MANIFVGLQTSADKVLILDYLGDSGSTLWLQSKSLEQRIEIETLIVHPLVSGIDVKRYGHLPKRQYLLFPYHIAFPDAKLMTEAEMDAVFPKAIGYLRENKDILVAREGGKFEDDEWYRFGRSQNLGIQGQPKLCIPRLVNRLHAAFDSEGIFYLDNVDVGGVTLKEDYQSQGLYYLMGLVNSKLLAWYFPFVSVPFRGSYYSANRQYIEQLPIRIIDFNNPDEVAKHDRMVTLVKRMIDLKKRHAEADAQKEDRRHDLARQIKRLDAEIDALVYDLYGLTEDEITIVEGQG
jgi:hypothetical protein